MFWEISWDVASRASRRDDCLRSRSVVGARTCVPTTAAVAMYSSDDLPEPEQLQLTMRDRLSRAATVLRPRPADGGQLTGRETEQRQIAHFVHGAVCDGGRQEVLYVSGMPGTGKTASVLEAVRWAQTLHQDGDCPSFSFAHVNAMCLSHPGAVFAEICRKVPDVRSATKIRRRDVGQNREACPSLNEKEAAAGLARYFSGEGPRSRDVVVLLVDEVDSLMTQAQTVLYRLFDWLSRPRARLAVIAIANTVDLPERLLPRVSSRVGVLRVNFAPYDRAQLRDILEERLRDGLAEGALTDDALKLCAARVAGASGDARKALQVCRRAVESRIASAAGGVDLGPVTLQDICEVEKDLLRANPAARAVVGLSQKARWLLLALVLELRRRPGEQALPQHVVLRRYEGIMHLRENCERGFDDAAGFADFGIRRTSQKHVDDVQFNIRRLEAMALLRVHVPPPGNAIFALEFGESLDVDDVADALASVVGDDLARDLLGCVVPPDE